MYPHQNNIRERRGGQPPMAPQHLMGMPQQGPGNKWSAIFLILVLGNFGEAKELFISFEEIESLFGPGGCIPGMLMSMNTPPVQIMTQGHYNQNSYSTQGQSNVSASYVTQQQGPQTPHQPSSYHQPTGYSSNNPQVVLTNKAVNRNKNYRKEYNVVKDYSEQKQQQNNFGNNEFNSNNGYNSYSQSSYNGQQNQSQIHQDLVNKNADTSTTKDKEENNKEESKQNSENSQECPAVPQSVMPNVKEKTPMCLVNELARFNKITHQYRLTDEQGPAHKKSFTVTLTLGTEEYTAEGPSIKKAQHSAAAEALAKTSFPHPTPKTNKNTHSGKSNITPTVELNALAMKRGEPAIYKLLDPPHPQQVYPQPAYTYRRPYGIRGVFNKRGRANFGFRGGRIPLKPTYGQNLHYTVSLKVGSWEFFGEGNSPQSARHDAASKALSQLKMLPVPEETCPVQKDNGTAPNIDQDLDSLIKSPISLVHEIALKRNMNVLFQVISEKGPPHMKTFVTKCSVGDLSATGEGNGKKVSKKRAAENMLVELKKLPPLSPSLSMNTMNLSRMKRKAPQTKKKSRNLIKIVQEHKAEPEYGEDINPISRLIQIQQVKKEKEPVYTLLEEKGMPRRREFVMEVAVGSLKAKGSGPNKKLAKKAAAQNLLNAMGYGKPAEQSSTNSANPTKPALKNQDGSQDMTKDRKVTFVDSDKGSENNAGGSIGRQVKPGIYVMSDGSPKSGMNMNTPINLQTTATIAKELLKGGNSPTADALIQNSSITKSTSQPVTHVFRPKDQLLYLADLLNFQVQFSDFPKGNHSEFLSLVTMSTDPSHVCHGSGPSIDESQDQAALTALRALSEMGLDSVTTSNPTKDIKKGGKGMGSMKK